MDFQSIVDSLYAPTCVVSVEKRTDGGYENIRIVAGNERYAGLLNLRPEPSDPADDDMEGIFIPGLPYTEYFQQSINFEEVCYRAAILKIRSLPLFPLT